MECDQLCILPSFERNANRALRKYSVPGMLVHNITLRMSLSSSMRRGGYQTRFITLQAMEGSSTPSCAMHPK